jgi:hypothetical protein
MEIDEAEATTPELVRNEVSRFGGLNPFGGPNWRVVLSETRKVLRGRGLPPAVDVLAGKVSATDIEKYMGLHKVQKYPCKGWIIERWFAPNKYSELDWTSAKGADGITPLMGPFPREGSYFMLAGPFADIPPMEDIKAAISMHIREEENSPKGYGEMMQAELLADQKRDEAAALAAEKFLADFYEQEVEPILTGTSLESQRIRNELAEQMGDFTQQAVR